MQSRQNVWRSACKARNAYNPVIALRAAFSSSTSCLRDDDHIPSMWETPPTALPAHTTKYDSNTARNALEDVNGVELSYGDDSGDTASGDVGNGRGSKGSVGLGHTVIRKVNKNNRNYGMNYPLREATESTTGWRFRRMPSEHSNTQKRRSNKAPISDQGTDTAPKTVKFASHTSWKQQMAQVREESFRVQNSRSMDDVRSRSFQKAKRAMEYDAMVILPEPSKLSTTLPVPWAVSEIGRKMHSVKSCLAADVYNFARWTEPTPGENRARTAVVQETEELIRSALTPETTGVELFGSEKNNVALPFSDLDFRIYDVHDPNMPHHRLFPRLERICRAMRASDKFILPIVRNSAHPILNCQHRESGIDIQIVAADDSRPQQEVVMKYIHQIPYLRDIFYVVRTMLSMRGLVDVYSGGLGSYGTFVMVAAALVRHEDHAKATQGTFKNNSAASQLVAFLHFYGNLDTHELCVAVHPQQLFKKHDDTMDDLAASSASAEKRGDLVRAGQWKLCGKKQFQPYLLCLQDPANPLNDLGRKGHAIKHIQATLSYLTRELSAGCLALKEWKKLKTEGHSEPENQLLPLVGRCHEVYHERRRKLEAYGKKLEAESASEGEPQGACIVRRTTERMDPISNVG